MIIDSKYLLEPQDKFCSLLRPSQVNIERFYADNNGYGLPEKEIAKRLVLIGRTMEDDIWRGVQYDTLIKSLEGDFKNGSLETIAKAYSEEVFLFGKAISNMYLLGQIKIKEDLVIMPELGLIKKLMNYKL